MRRGGSEHRCCPAHIAMPAQLRLGFLKATAAPGTTELKRYLPTVCDAALQGKRRRIPSISLPRSRKRRSAVRVPTPLKLTHFGRCSHETKEFDFGTRCQTIPPAVSRPSVRPSVGPSAGSLSPMTAPRRHRTRLSPPASPRPGPAHLQPPPPPPQNTRGGTAAGTAAELRTNPRSPSLLRSVRPRATARSHFPSRGPGQTGRAAPRPAQVTRAEGERPRTAAAANPRPPGRPLVVPAARRYRFVQRP